MDGWKPHVVYAIGQIEAGEEKGTAHIQAYVNLKRDQRLSWVKKKDSRAHFVPVTRDNGASAYCMKEETRLEGPVEVGERPLRRNDKKDWKKIKKLA